MGTEGKVTRAVAACGLISMAAYLVAFALVVRGRARLWIRRP